LILLSFGRAFFQTNGAVAQLGERLPCKQEVIGSIPFSSTKKLKTIEAKAFLFSAKWLEKVDGC
jgi:hypothetical protein